MYSLEMVPIPILRDERIVWNYKSTIRQVCPDAFEWTPVEWNSHYSEDHVVVGRKLMCLSKGLRKKKL